VVVPTATQYITASGKQALALLQSAASVIPVPLLQDAIKVALKVIETCEVRRIPRREGCETVHDVFIRRHQPSNKRSKSYKIGSAIS
jgi:hypothetical protein